MKRLRQGNDAVIGGVCSGISEYLGIDPVIVRIIFLVMVFLGLGYPILVYLIIWIALEISS